MRVPDRPAGRGDPLGDGIGLIQTDETGQGVSMTGTVTDITERRAAEQALRQREREMRSLADNTPDILTRFDRKLRYVFANAAIEKATGQPPQWFLGRTIREVGMPGDLCESWEQALRS